MQRLSRFGARWRGLLLLALGALVVVLLLLWQQQLQRARPNPQEPGGVPAPGITQGGAYAEALVGRPARFNPLLDHLNRVDRDVDRLLYRGLVRFDSRGVPHGDLAESWGISQDGTVYNFALRANARWHDGKPVTAEDVAFTVSLLRHPDLPVPEDLRAFWQEVEVEAFPDGRTVQFRLPEPFAPFLDYLTFGVLPKHIWGDIAPQDIPNAVRNLQPVGNGPFRFSHLIINDGQIRGVVLRAFEDFYLGKPLLEQVTFRYYESPAQALQAYQEGEVLGIDQVTPEIFAQALADPNLNFYTTRLPRLTLVLFNLQNAEVPFFQDKEVRQALYKGINRRWIVDRILNGQALLADGPIFPGSWAYYEGTPRVDYDPEGAIAQLKAAGYTFPETGEPVREKDGQPLAFQLLYPDTPAHRAIAEAIREDWTRLGVQVELVAVPYGRLLADYLDPREYQAALVDLDLSRSPDPDPYPFWHQAMITGGQNYSMWDDRRASEYLEQARTTVALEERARLYRNFQAYFARELPALPLFYPLYTYAVDAQVRGVRLGPLFDLSDRFNTITTWYIGVPGTMTTVEPTQTAQP